MKLFNFSRKPEQLRLFPGEMKPSLPNPLRILEDFFPAILFTLIISINIFHITAIVLRRYYGDGLWVPIRYQFLRFFEELPELFWLISLSVAVAISYLPAPKFLVIARGYSLLVKIAICTALAIYLVQVFETTRIFLTYPAKDAPWSLLLLGIGIVGLILWKLPHQQLAPWKEKLEVKDYLTIVNSTRTLLLQILGGAVLALGLYYTSQSMNISQENVRLTLLKQESDRLNQSITQLADENSEVRLVAIYNLQKLAIQSFENYRLIANVLNNYIRNRAPWIETNGNPAPERDETPADVQEILIFLGSWMTEYYIMDNEAEVNPLIKSSDPRRKRNSNMGAPPNFSKTDLRKVKLDFAMMDEWVLKFAHLEGASLQGTYLRKAVLEGANLSNVNLTDATLDGANLKNADLRAANLVGTSLQDSDIEGADLTTAVGLAPEMVKKAKNYDKAKLPPGLLPVVGGRNP